MIPTFVISSGDFTTLICLFCLRDMLQCAAAPQAVILRYIMDLHSKRTRSRSSNGLGSQAHLFVIY